MCNPRGNGCHLQLRTYAGGPQTAGDFGELATLTCVISNDDLIALIAWLRTHFFASYTSLRSGHHEKDPEACPHAPHGESGRRLFGDQCVIDDGSCHERPLGAKAERST